MIFPLGSADMYVFMCKIQPKSAQNRQTANKQGNRQVVAVGIQPFISNAQTEPPPHLHSYSYHSPSTSHTKRPCRLHGFGIRFVPNAQVLRFSWIKLERIPFVCPYRFIPQRYFDYYRPEAQNTGFSQSNVGYSSGGRTGSGHWTMYKLGIVFLFPIINAAPHPIILSTHMIKYNYA